MQSTPARMRVDQEAERRGNTAVVISTLLSLVVVVAAIAVVAWLVLRTPSQAVDSAERLDPVGTALPAPTDPPELPALVPTVESESEPEPEPTALGFTGEAPEVPETPQAADLPTQTAQEQEAEPEPESPSGPTPTPRVIAQPTEPPPTPAPPTSVPPTLPPSVPVTQVPVVALEPVESAPPPTAVPVETREVETREPAPTPVDRDDDDDPFNIFDDDSRAGIVDVQDDPLARVREMQDDLENDRPIAVPTRAPGNERRRDDADDSVVQVIDIPDISVPEPDRPNRDEDEEPRRVVTAGDDPYEIVMPDVDAMIDEITAQARDPNRNPNARDGRRITSRDNRDDDDDDRDDDEDDEDDEDLTPAERRSKSLRDRIRERMGRGDSDSRSIMPGSGSDDGPCMDPTAPGFPFDC